MNKMNKKVLALLVVGAVGSQTAQLNAWEVPGKQLFRIGNALYNPFDFTKAEPISEVKAKYVVVQDDQNHDIILHENQIGFMNRGARGRQNFTPINCWKDEEDNDVVADQIENYFNRNYITQKDVVKEVTYFVERADDGNNNLLDEPLVDNEHGMEITTRKGRTPSLEDIGQKKMDDYRTANQAKKAAERRNAALAAGANPEQVPEGGHIADYIHGARLDLGRGKSAAIITTGWVGAIGLAATAALLSRSCDDDEDEEGDGESEDDNLE